MANIQVSYDQIIHAREGLYSNDAGDSGGETVLGLTRKYDADWAGWPIVDAYKKLLGFPGNLKGANLDNMAMLYYEKKYWMPMKLESVANQSIATELFESGINIGINLEGTYLQRTLNVLNRNGKDYPDLSVDGIIGSKTLTALSIADPENVLIGLNVLQGARYFQLCEQYPKNEKFMNGWLKRAKYAA